MNASNREFRKINNARLASLLNAPSTTCTGDGLMSHYTLLCRALIRLILQEKEPKHGTRVGRRAQKPCCIHYEEDCCFNIRMRSMISISKWKLLLLARVTITGVVRPAWGSSLFIISREALAINILYECPYHYLRHKQQNYIELKIGSKCFAVGRLQYVSASSPRSPIVCLLMQGCHIWVSSKFPDIPWHITIFPWQFI